MKKRRQRTHLRLLARKGLIDLREVENVHGTARLHPAMRQRIPHLPTPVLPRATLAALQLLAPTTGTYTGRLNTQVDDNGRPIVGSG